jgi:hypothetical protein
MSLTRKMSMVCRITGEGEGISGEARLRAQRSAKGWETAKEALSVEGRLADKCKSPCSGHDTVEEKMRSTSEAGVRQTRLSLL